MKNNLLRPKHLAVAVIGGLLAAGQAFAAGIATNPDPASVLQTGSVDVTIEFTGDGVTTAFTGALEYDTTQFDATAVGAAGVTCSVNDAFTATEGRVALAAFSLGPPLASGTLCTVTFTTAAAALGSYPTTWIAPTFGGSAGGDTVDDGQIDVIDIPPEPPVITFTPDGGTVSLAQGGGAVGDPATNGTITVDATGGVGGGTGSYNCAVPAGFTVSNNANAAFGNGTVDMSVGCTMGASAASANMTCAVTDDNGDRNVNFTLECPAGASAVYSSAPAAGADLAQCSGAPGETVTTTLTITNTGTPANPDSAADDLAISCSVDNPANFAIIAGPTTPLEAGSSTDVTVECTIPDADEAVGTLDCNGNTYGLSALVQTLPPAIPQPNVIPANSFWSKMVLFGLLAGLGMLVVSLRRNG